MRRPVRILPQKKWKSRNHYFDLYWLLGKEGSKLVVLLIMLFLLTVFLLLPVGMDAVCEEKRVTVKVKVGPASLSMLSFPKAGEEKAKKNKRDKREKDKKKMDRELILELIHLGLRALGRLRRRLRIDDLQLYLLVSTSDPYRTAMLYGSINAGVYALLSGLNQAVDVRNQDIQVNVDFDRGRMDLYGRLILTIHVGQLLVVGIIFGYEFLRWKLQKRRELKNIEKERTEDHGKQNRRPDAGHNEQVEGNG